MTDMGNHEDMAVISSLFTEGRAEVAATAIAPGGLSKTTRGYAWPEARVDESVRRLTMAVLCVIASIPLARMDYWEAYIVTMCAVFFSGTIGTLRDRQNGLAFDELPGEFIDAVAAHLAYIREHPAEMATHTTDVVTPPRLGGAIVTIDAALLAAAKLEGIYGHFSLVLFLAGKQVTADNISALTERRPSAIIRKYGDSGISHLLSGPARIADENFARINTAWTRMAGARAAMVESAIAFEHSGGNQSQEIVWITFQLMRWSNWSYVPQIKDLIHASPWIWNMPELRPSLAVYLDSARALAQKPVSMQPYWKLIHTDKTRLFLRKDMLPLITTAKNVAARTQVTLLKFVGGSPADNAVYQRYEEYEALRAARARREAAA